MTAPAESLPLTPLAARTIPAAIAVATAAIATTAPTANTATRITLESRFRMWPIS